MNNLILIGMPGSGKTTFGQKLAVYTQRKFIDTDQLIEQRFASRLQTVLERRGIAYIRHIEEQTICQLAPANSVIATGGSAVYSESAMRKLTSLGTVIYLQISLKTLLARVTNANARGLVKLPATTLQNLYYQRRPLYEQWAEVCLYNDWPLTAWRFSQLLSELESKISDE